MSAALATYGYTFDGWHWEYRLFLERLEAEGRKGEEFAIMVYELEQMSEFPQKSSYIHPTPRKGPAIAAACLAGLISLALFVWSIVVLKGDDGIFKIAILLGALFTIGTYRGILKLTARKDWVTRAEFRRKDGADMAVIWDINDTQRDEFENFLLKVQAVIQKAVPPTSYA